MLTNLNCINLIVWDIMLNVQNAYKYMTKETNNNINNFTSKYLIINSAKLLNMSGVVWIERLKCT